jgi:hypothetical protein
MSTSSCLANTGFDFIPAVVLGVLALLAGSFLVRAARARLVLVALALVGGSLLFDQASAKPASAACAPSGAASSLTATIDPPVSTTPTSQTTVPPSATPLDLRVSYLVNLINASGFVQGPSLPDFGDTAQTVIALQATGITSSDVTGAIARATSYLAGNIDAYVDGTAAPSPTDDSASALAQLLLVAHATSDPSLQALVPGLVSRLEATQGLAEVNLFGAGDPTYDGVIRQSLSLEALVISGVPSSDSHIQAGLTWLLAQQCSGGGFSSDVANNACSGLEVNYQGPDTNSTGYALVALGALSQPSGPGSAIENASSYLSSSELAGAGWDYFGGGFDASSTAIVIEGLRAIGQDMSSTSGSWSRSGISPVAELGTLQVSSAGPGQGGFLFQSSSSIPDVISTEQAVTAMSGQNLPL